MSISPFASMTPSVRPPIRVLLLEDNSRDADLTIRTLERAGYSPHCDRVQSKEEFSERIDGREYDVILADYNLPSFDGISALKLFLNRRLDIPFILISGSVGEETAIESLKTGATDYVLKHHITRLGPVVQRALRESDNSRQRRLAEEAVRQSNEVYKQIFERTRAILMLIDPLSGAIEYANPAACRFYGYDLDELRRMNICNINVEPVQSDSFGAISGEQTGAESSLFRHRIASGETRFVEAHMSEIDLGGRTLTYSIINDVTEQTHARDALQKSESRARRLVESNLIGVIFSMIDGDVFDANEAFLKLAGYTEEDLKQGRITWEALTPQNARFLDPDAAGEIRSIGSCTPYETDIIRSDGRVIPVLIGCATLEGSQDAFISFILDMTERNKTEQALHRSEERYRDLFENAADVIYTHDLEGKFTSINCQVVRITGFSPDELVGANIGDLVAPEHRKTVHESFEFKGSMDSARFEAELISNRGERIPVEINNRFILEDLEPIGIQGIARDISDRKRAETERRRLEEELIQAQKMESVGRLAGGVAHDFNNLLTAIIGNAQLVLAETQPGDRSYDNLVQIEKAAARAASLTRQLLIFGRRQKLERRAININDTIGDFLGLLQRIIGEDIEVCTRISPGLGAVFADPRQIEQVIMNLGVNARDAMPRGGRLTIATDQVSLNADALKDKTFAKEGDYVRLTVSDTGAGMNEEVMQHMFEPFFTTKGVDKGTGLGLAVVYSIINQHGGFIEVESQPGRGSSFAAFLPVSESVSEERCRETVSPLRGGVETVLIAEDEGILRKLVKEVLSGLGYNVILACDGVEAVRMYETNRQSISLVLLDFVMPRMGGREVYERLRAMGNDAPVMFMTGHSTEVSEGQFIEEIGATLIRKPYSVGELARSVREVLDKKEALAL